MLTAIGGRRTGYTESERRTVLLACCLAGFIAPLMSTMMNLSLVNIGQDFGVGSHSLAYVNTVYLLASVIFMVPLSKVGDIYGKRRLFIAGVLVVAAACLLASASPSFHFLLACRVMMGAGSSAIMCTSISMITDTFPVTGRGGAIGLQTMCVYIGLAAGPPLGGVMNDLFGWHSLFLLVVPIALGSVLVISRFRKEIRPDEGGSMDVLGSALYGVGIMLSMFGMINLPKTWAYACLAMGLVTVAIFVLWQLRCANHLLNVRLFRNKVFSGSCLATFMNYASSYSISYFLALYLQSIGGLTAMEAGTLMLVQPAIQAVGTPFFGRCSDRMRDKRLLPTLGMAVSAAGILTFMGYGTDTGLPTVVATMSIIGVGFSLFSAPNTSVIMGSVPPSETGEASAMVSVMRQTGMMVSMGIAMLFISLVMGSADNLAPENYADFLTVMRCSFAVCFVMCVIGAFVSMLRGTGPVTQKG